MASSDTWADFDIVRHNVKLNTVDRLKQIIVQFNDQCGTSFTRSGKKQELIDRITRELELWKRSNNVDKWFKAKEVLSPSRQFGSSPTAYTAASSPVSHYTPASSSPAFHKRPAIPPYDPYAPPRLPGQSASAPVASSSSPPSIHFKLSPFFRVEKQISSIIECPALVESFSQADRKQQSLSFQLSGDVVTKLATANPCYQLRLYCTSSTYYTSTSAFRPSVGPCPIEFPPTCEIRVNNEAISANVKGMKKKPGTAPPPDLGRGVKLVPNSSNRVELIYVNSQQPTLSKKYYMVVMLVEATSVEQLVDRLRKGKYRSSSDVVAKMTRSAAEDDDIVAGHQKMSLKCPLSYMRISTPCRSAHCVHSQCFDAMSWFSMMEQTTTWLCPVCEKVLNADDLIVDGFFDEILKGTNEDVEDVIVEADGQWHTSDNKFASAAWKATHSVKDPTPLPPAPVKKRSPTPVKFSALGDMPLKREPTEIVILDSDDEDEGQVKRELSTHRPHYASFSSMGSQPPRSQTGESDVIDLTGDSDEETAVDRSSSRKRKSDDHDTTSPTEHLWKKSRVEIPPQPTASLPLPPVPAPAPYTNGSSYSQPRDPRRTLPPPPQPSNNRYATNGYPARPPAPTYVGPYIPPGGAPLPPRPTTGAYSPSPPSAYPVSRPNGSSSSSSWRT